MKITNRRIYCWYWDWLYFGFFRPTVCVLVFICTIVGSFLASVRLLSFPRPWTLGPLCSRHAGATCSATPRPCPRHAGRTPGRATCPATPLPWLHCLHFWCRYSKIFKILVFRILLYFSSADITLSLQLRRSSLIWRCGYYYFYYQLIFVLIWKPVFNCAYMAVPAVHQTGTVSSDSSAACAAAVCFPPAIMFTSAIPITTYDRVKHRLAVFSFLV